MKFLRKLLSRKPKMITARKDAKEHEIGGGWGNAINWFDRKEFDGKHFFFRIMGWKTPHPEVGDYLIEKMNSGKTGRFVFQTIEPCGDPPDMFFGNVAFLDYKPQPPACADAGSAYDPVGIEEGKDEENNQMS